MRIAHLQRGCYSGAAAGLAGQAAPSSAGEMDAPFVAVRVTTLCHATPLLAVDERARNQRSSFRHVAWVPGSCP